MTTILSALGLIGKVEGRIPVLVAIFLSVAALAILKGAYLTGGMCVLIAGIGFWWALPNDHWFVQWTAGTYAEAEEIEPLTPSVSDPTPPTEASGSLPDLVPATGEA